MTRLLYLMLMLNLFSCATNERKPKPPIVWGTVHGKIIMDSTLGQGFNVSVTTGDTTWFAPIIEHSKIKQATCNLSGFTPISAITDSEEVRLLKESIRMLKEAKKTNKHILALQKELENRYSSKTYILGVDSLGNITEIDNMPTYKSGEHMIDDGTGAVENCEWDCYDNFQPPPMSRNGCFPKEHWPAETLKKFAN